MHKKNKRDMRLARLSMQATFRYTKDVLRFFRESLVPEDAKKIRIRLLRGLYNDRTTYMARSLMKWKRESEEAARNAGLGNNN